MRGEGTAGRSVDGERVILHVDMDCFYAACERRREPRLRGEPVVVGMGYEDGERHGAVATASYEARAHGVESAQPISQALEALPRVDGDGTDAADDGPRGHYRPVDLSYYESVSDEVRAILHGVSETVREVSIDEAYLDVTGRVGWHSVGLFAENLRARIGEEVGVPASVGVAPNMSTAKIASDHDKPDGLVVVRPEAVREFLAPLPIDDLHGIGPVTAGELRSMGVETVADLAAADPGTLVDRFGTRGRELHERARGVDPRPVEPVGRPKSLSSESAFTEPTADSERMRERLARLAGEVTDRAAARDALYKTIGIKVVRPPFEVNTRERSLSGPVADPPLVRSVVGDLAAEFEGEAVRKLGVRLSNLSFAEGTQSGLDRWDGATGDGGPPGGGNAAEGDAPDDAVADGGDDASTGAAATDGSDGRSADPTGGPPTEESDAGPLVGQTTVFDFV